MEKKKSWLFLCLTITAITVIVANYDHNGNLPATETPATTATTVASAEKIFQFNQNQLDFLKSIGISSVSNIKDKKICKEFQYDGETIKVFLNDNNGITAVFCGPDGANPLWNDKKGKVGMLKKEKLAYLDKFIDTHHQEYDQAQQVTWIDAGFKRQFGHKGIYTYMGIKGREKSGAKWLRAHIHYSDNEWIFFNKITFSNTNETWTYNVTQRPTHKVVTGGIHEYVDIPLDDIRKGLEILAYGENPKIDFLGDDYHDDKLCSQYEIENTRTYLILADAIKLEK